MYKGNIHAPKHAKLIYENATAPVFSLISNGGFSWNLNTWFTAHESHNNRKSEENGRNIQKRKREIFHTKL